MKFSKVLAQTTIEVVAGAVEGLRPQNRTQTPNLQVSFTSLSELAIYWEQGELR